MGKPQREKLTPQAVGYEQAVFLSVPRAPPPAWFIFMRRVKEKGSAKAMKGLCPLSFPACGLKCYYPT